MHIGMIGGIGPAATLFYYKQLAKVYSEHDVELELTIVNSNVKNLIANLAAGRGREQATEFKRLADRLVSVGAECVVITSMGGHFCLPEFAPISPLPIIEGPSSVRDHLITRGIKRPGILGTRKVMETHLYGVLDEFEPVIPEGAGLDQAGQDYIDIAVAGDATSEQGTRLLDAGERLIEQQGAEVILLGGTDLSIVYDDSTSIPFIDTAQVHVDAIVAAASIA